MEILLDNGIERDFVSKTLELGKKLPQYKTHPAFEHEQAISVQDNKRITCNYKRTCTYLEFECISFDEYIIFV